MSHALRVIAVARSSDTQRAAPLAPGMRWKHVDDLAAVIDEDHDAFPPDAPPALLRAAAAQRALCARIDILPIRAGAAIVSIDALDRYLRHRRDALDASLRALARTVEFSISFPGVRAPRVGIAAGPPGLASEQGRAYLHSRRAELEAPDVPPEVAAAAAPLIRALGGVARRVLLTPESQARPFLSAALLVPRSDADCLRERFEPASRASAHRAVLSGPFPPATFACDQADAGPSA